MLWVLKRTVSMRRVFFEHPKHMIKLMGKKINAILGAQSILIWTYVLALIPYASSEGGVHWGKSATIRESNHGSGVCKEHYA